MDDKKSAAPGSQPDTTQEYVIELDEKELQEPINDRDRSEFKKHLLFMMENDLERREVTIILPEGRNKIVLPKSEVYFLMDLLKRQTREWHENQPSC